MRTEVVMIIIYIIVVTILLISMKIFVHKKNNEDKKFLNVQKLSSLSRTLL